MYNIHLTNEFYPSLKIQRSKMTNVTVYCERSGGTGFSELLISVSASNNMEVHIVEDSGVFISEPFDGLEIGESKELRFVVGLLEQKIGKNNVISSGGSVIDCFITPEAARYLSENKSFIEAVSHIVN